MRQHQSSSPDQMKRLLSLLFKAQSIAVMLDIDLQQKVVELFGRNIPWAPKADPVMVHPGETDCVNLSQSQRMVLAILLEAQKALSPKEIYHQLRNNGNKEPTYSHETVRGVCRFLDQNGLVHRSRQEGRVVYHAE